MPTAWPELGSGNSPRELPAAGDVDPCSTSPTSAPPVSVSTTRSAVAAPPQKKRLGMDADVASNSAIPSGAGWPPRGSPAAEILAGVAPTILRSVPAAGGLLLLPTPPAVTLSPTAQLPNQRRARGVPQSPRGWAHRQTKTRRWKSSEERNQCRSHTPDQIQPRTFDPDQTRLREWMKLLRGRKHTDLALSPTV